MSCWACVAAGRQAPPHQLGVEAPAGAHRRSGPGDAASDGQPAAGGLLGRRLLGRGLLLGRRLLLRRRLLRRGLLGRRPSWRRPSSPAPSWPAFVAGPWPASTARLGRRRSGASRSAPCPCGRARSGPAARARRFSSSCSLAAGCARAAPAPAPGPGGPGPRRPCSSARTLDRAGSAAARARPGACCTASVPASRERAEEVVVGHGVEPTASARAVAAGQRSDSAGRAPGRPASARSAATTSGAGRPAGRSGRVTPVSTSAERGSPGRAAKRPSVSGRSPTADAVGPARLAHQVGHGPVAACRRPPASAPDAVLDRRPGSPAAGDQAVGRRDRSRRRWWRAAGRRPRTARGGDAQPVVVEVAVEADHHRVGRSPSRDRRRRRRAALAAPRRRPGPPHDQHPLARLDQRGRGHGEVTTSSPGVDAVAAPAWPRPRRAGGRELLVTNTTCSPAARSRATASAAPGSGSSPSQTTPSRSSTQAIGGMLARPTAPARPAIC